jgi:predicted AlkP superfamily phosphohydrolase/phosphomutase
MNKPRIDRVLVIGLDGGTFDILNPQMQAGNMPALKGLVEAGAAGILNSTHPPITGPAWLTFATGCNPGKHGVIDFVELDRKTHRVSVKDVSRIPLSTFWDELGAHDKRSGIMGVPMTYPPRPINGFLVTGLMTPPNSTGYTYPADLLQTLAASGLRFPHTEGATVNPAQPVEYLNEIISDMAQRVDAACHLIAAEKPECSVFVFGATDPVQHQFWHIISAQADHTGLKAHLDRFYHAVDQGVAKLLGQIDEQTLVLVISDHGFGRLRGFIHLNNWLLEKGYLKLKSDVMTRLRALIHRWGYTPENLYRMARQMGFDMRRVVNQGRAYSLTRRAFLSFENVDWDQTTAYSLGHIGQVYIPDQRGRTAAEYERFRAKLADDLLGMTHPDTGERLISKVYTREDLYHGPFVDSAPDLLLEPAGYTHVAFGESEFASNKLVGSSLHSGHHRLEGILIASGAGVQRNWALDAASIADIAPTILYALGVPIPRVMDGKPILAAFDPALIDDRPVAYSEGATAHAGYEHSGYSPEEEKLVLKRLKDLGYTA